MKRQVHKVGDGVHFIAGKNTSDGCILVNLETLCVHHGLPMLNDIWNQVYPDDPMSDEDLIYILLIHTELTEMYDPSIPDNVADVLKDVRSMGCHALADRVIELLKERGILTV